MRAVSFEYAKSDRSRCKECRDKIGMGELRFGKHFYIDDAHRQSCWFHVSCIPAEHAHRSLAASLVPGFEDLTKKEKALAKKRFAELCGAAEATVTHTSTRNARKRGKSAAKKDEGYTKVQREEFSSQKKALADLKIDELKELCRLNDQKVTGTKSELVDRVADGRVLGRIPKCSTCGGGRLRFNSSTGKYVCPGYMEDDEFVRCHATFASSEVKRLPWQDRAPDCPS